MTFAYPVPVWALLLGIVAILALAIRTYAGFRDLLTPRQRVVLTALRALTLAVIAFFLLRPVITLPQTQQSDAVVPVLIDNSRSMRIADADGKPRIDEAKAIAHALEKSLGQRFKMEVLAVGEGVTAATIDRINPEGRSSDLRAAVAAARERYRGQQIAGMVLVSDGADTGEAASPESAARAAAASAGLDVPVFAFGVGAPRVARDREVLGVSVGDPALTDASVELAATIVSHGFGNATPVEVRVLENGRLVHLRRITPQDDVPWTERFRVAPRQDAASVYSVELTADDAELTPDNNKQAVLVRPPARPRRLLLVEGAPGFEHSFIKRAWLQDRGLEVDSVVRKGRNDAGEETYYVQAGKGRADQLAAGYPSRRDVLFNYDAIILANVDADLLTEAQIALTADFVAERGGGLLLLGSRTLAANGVIRSALQELMPVESSDRFGTGVGFSTSLGTMGRELFPVAEAAQTAAPATSAGGGAGQGAPAPAPAVSGQTSGAAAPPAALPPPVPAPANRAQDTGVGGASLGLNRVSLTSEGARHPVMQLGATPESARQQWAALPPLASSTALGDAKPGASVLAVTNGSGGRVRPLVAVQRYGRGRAMVFAGEGSWRWRMRLPSANKTFDTFWRQAGRWLAATAPSPIALTLPSPPSGTTGRLEVDVRDADFRGIPDARVTLRVTDPSGTAHDVTTMADAVAGGRYHGTFRTDQAGLFRVEADVRRGNAPLGIVSDWMLVGGVDREMTDPRLNIGVLQRLASESGGAVLTASQVGDLPNRLAAAAARAVNAPRRERELWHTPWTFVLVIACIAGEWTFRRRWGLR